MTLLALGPAMWWVVDGLLHRRFGSDVIAVLAPAGTIAVGEALAGAVFAVMLTGGRLLEERAGRRARRDLGALLSLAPRIADRRTAGGLDTIDVGEVRPGDRLLVRAGETVPVDGQVEHGTAVLDESTLTGETAAGRASHRGRAARRHPQLWGALRSARDQRRQVQHLCGIVRLVEQAAAESAPFVRLADRYSAFSFRSPWRWPGRRGSPPAIRCAGGRSAGGGHALPADSRGADRVRPACRGARAAVWW